MKKLSAILVMLTVACSVTSAKEIDPKSPVGVGVMKTGSVCKVYYKGQKPGDVKVTISDEEGNVVYRETLHDVQDFMRPYNISTLKKGEYKIVVEDETRREEKKILLSEEKSKEKSSLSLIRLSKKSDKYVLNVPNKVAGELQVRIYNRDNKLVYDDKETIEGDFARLYNLSTIGEDFYFQVTNTTGETHTISYKNR